jgi:PAS domain S-box-containing protein
LVSLLSSGSPAAATLRYGFAVASTAAALGSALALSELGLEKFLLLSSVAVTAWYAGFGPALLALLLSTLALVYVFIPPEYSFAIASHRLPYVAGFAIFGGVIGWLAVALRRAQQSLVRAGNELRVKVQERTADLERSNRQLRDEITERKHAEDEVRKQAALLMLAHDAILVRDLESRVVFWNTGAQDTYGFTAAEAAGRVTHDLLQTQFPVSLAEVTATLRTHGRWSGELTHTTRDGSTIVVASRHSLLRDEHGAPTAILEINRDITDRKRAEEALRLTEAQLARVTRVTTLGEVTASIAHELNQPLTAIVNNANAGLQLMPSGEHALDDVREALADIVGDAERASAIIEGLRALAKQSPPQKVPLRLADVVDDVVTMAARDVAARGVTIGTDVAPDLPIVLGDRVQLQQVLLNLVVNGLDAMATVSDRERRLEIRGRTERHDGTAAVTISVLDRGVGLADSKAEKMFDAFYTTKPQGIGLGLAISRSIIEAHGGRLWAEANQGPGATFAFRLPSAPG